MYRRIVALVIALAIVLALALTLTWSGLPSGTFRHVSDVFQQIAGYAWGGRVI